nr:hypothetical protein [Tanacetum cinerariifolium]
MEAGGKDRPPMLAPEGYMENYKNVSQGIRNQLDVEAKAIQIILTGIDNDIYSGIDNDIYSTVDACPNAYEIWKAIERPQQAVAKNKGKAIVNSSPPTYDKLDMVAEDDAVSKDKEIDKLMALILYRSRKSTNLPITTSELHQNQERDLLASLIEKLKCEIDDRKNRNKFLESSNKTIVDKLKGDIEDFKNKNKSLESSNNHFKEANNELAKTNQLMFKDIKKFQSKLDRRSRRLLLLEEAGIQLSAKQVDWRDDTDNEPEDQELEAHYLYMAQIQEVTPDAVENFRPIFDVKPFQKIGVAPKTDFKRVKRPLIERVFIFHLERRALSLSIVSSQAERREE